MFRDEGDRERFLSILGRTVALFRWKLHAYVLMGNHYHLLLETPETTLSRGMRQLNGIYTQAFNRRHRRSGHLFQGRFKAILVEKDAHLLELCRYVVLNPVRVVRRLAGARPATRGVPRRQTRPIQVDPLAAARAVAKSLGSTLDQMRSNPRTYVRERRLTAWALRSHGLVGLEGVGRALGVGIGQASALARAGEKDAAQGSALDGKMAEAVARAIVEK